MTKLEVAKLVGVLMASFPNGKVAAETSAIYERMLADLDYPAANAAVERLLATSRFLPTVAEIREAALTLYAGELRPGGDAWGSVLTAIRKYGYVRVPGVDFQFDDPVTADAVRALNWTELCNSENVAADRARFIELYDKLAASARRSQLSEGLPAMQRFRALQAKRDQVELPTDSTVTRLIAQVSDSTRASRVAWCARCNRAQESNNKGCTICSDGATP